MHVIYTDDPWIILDGNTLQKKNSRPTRNPSMLRIVCPLKWGVVTSLLEPVLLNCTSRILMEVGQTII
jgi:hypothetical protein